MADYVSRERTMPVRFTDLEQKWNEQKRKTAYELKLAQGFAVADMYLTQQYLDRFSAGTVYEPDNTVMDVLKMRVFQISKLVYDPEEQINDKLISVYSSLHNMDSAVALIIRSNSKEVGFYAAVRSEDNAELAGETLCSVLKGNFPGIDISAPLNGNEKRALLDAMTPDGTAPKSLATVSLIPSERDDDKNEFIQGLEKFIGSMNRKDYTAVLLAAPVDSVTLARRKHGYEELYASLSPHAKISMSFAHSETDSVNESISNSFSKSINNSVSNSNGTSTSKTEGRNKGHSDGFSANGDGWGMSSSDSYGSSTSFTSGTSFSTAISSSTGSTDTESTSKGTGRSVGDTDTTSLTFENKGVQELMNRADTQLKRIECSKAYGMWDFCGYFFSDDIAVTAQAANVYKSVMMGQESSVENAHINLWNLGLRNEIRKIVDNVKYLVHPVAEIPAFDSYEAQQVTPTNMINGKELPIALGLPRKSVPGVAVVEMAEFGRAVVFEDLSRVERLMDFGNIYHMGLKEEMRVSMDVDLLASHCFITGSSGSGKSYATYQLLDNLLKRDVHMMVIEPAKGEYKQVFGGLKGIRIFNTDPNVYKMLRINPFQFPENLHVLTHIEKLIQIFNASWALYAAMPAILKEAVVKSYTKCGWDVMNSVWIEGISEHKYPVFQDVLEILPVIINSSDYSADSKGDYKGALLTRVQSMTTGITGLIFERSEGIQDSILFDSNAIVDLSDIGSEETVALLMGVLIMRLGEYRQSVRKAGTGSRDARLKHVTVLEEAHNILKRTSKDQSQEGANIVGKSVEMISNSIKEMRTYGEGFIIIDQSPMAVDTSAIENTSTKIIMNTPAKDACEELSSALSLNEDQSKELSRLGTGVAAVMQKGWLTPVLMKIDMWDNHYEAEVKRPMPDEICLLKGRMLTELYRQQEKRAFSLIAMKKIIRESPIDDEKKRDFEDMVALMNQMLLKRADGLAADEVGRLYLLIAGCEGLLDVIDDKQIYTNRQLEAKYKKDPEWFTTERVKNLHKHSGQWLARFQAAFHHYAFVEDDGIVREIIQSILYEKSDGGKNGSKYHLLYDLMENGTI